MSNDKKATEIASRFSDETLKAIVYKACIEALRWKDETMSQYIEHSIIKRLRHIERINYDKQKV